MSEHSKSLQTDFVFKDIDMMSQICGSNNEHVVLMEQLLGNPIYLVGNQFRYITHSSENLEDFKHLCGVISDAYIRNIQITSEYISTLFFQLTGKSNAVNKEEAHKELNAKARDTNSIDAISMISVPITGKQVLPRTEGQKRIVQALENNLLSFLVGPAGTGKTYFATAYALSQLLLKKKERYVITRPVVEAGERLGFLPGDFEQKILPYLRPIYDVLYELAGEEIVNLLQEKKQIEIAPLAYMRGRTLKNSIVLLDEAQNCTPSQMRMFLTRIGEGSIGIVNGDLSQSDIFTTNGLQEAVKIFSNMKHIAIVTLCEADVQRSKLAKLVVEAYNKRSNATQDNK